MSDFLRRLDEYVKFFRKITHDLELDNRCKGLLITFFIAYPKGMGFGELTREIKRIHKSIISENGKGEYAAKNWFEFSKPTLSEHLDHLEAKGMLKSEEIEDKRYPVINPKKYHLTPLLEQIAEDYLLVKSGERGIYNLSSDIRNMDDDQVVTFVFVMFGIYGMKALYDAIYLEDENHSKHARKIAYNYLDEALRGSRTAILALNRKDKILKAIREFSNRESFEYLSKRMFKE